MSKPISRREMLITTLKGATTIATISMTSSVIFSRCKNKTTDQSNTLLEKSNEKDVQPCPGQDQITPNEMQIRSSLKYVDQSTFLGRRCDNCKVYTLPQNGSLCGGCKIVPGPIHPKGYCTAWLARM